MKNIAALYFAPFFICLALSFSSAHAQEDADTNPQAKHWRLEHANDAFVDSDNQFSSSFSLEQHSAVFSSLNDIPATLPLIRRLARVLLPEDSKRYYRETWAIGQNLQTPDSNSTRDLILDDVPYMGLIAWENSYIAYNDQKLSGFQVLLGLTGEVALGEQAQKLPHKVLATTIPRGWRNQLDSEPIINVYYTHKSKLWRNTHFDGAISYEAALGNFFTYGQAGLELRFGRLPDGFMVAPDPIGHGLDYDATLRRVKQPYLYGTLSLGGRGIALALPRQGNILRDDNTWTENNTIEMEHFVGQLTLGLHYLQPRWGAHLNYSFSTNTLRPDTVTPREDLKNHFGSVVIEWRF